jgi:ring-1,2-phenylacetyl-CoA epoxidase subunit PaaC
MNELTLDPALRQPLADRLLALADDEMLLGHRNSEWTGHAPILEEDIAIANLAQDEMGHASLWYGAHGALTGSDADQLVFFRDASEYRNCQLTALPKGDWAFTLMRQYLFDAAELCWLERLKRSEYQPIADIAAKVEREEAYHYRHSSAWIRRLGLGTEESKQRCQTALDELWAYALQLFVPLPGDSALVEAGITPDLRRLQSVWEGRVRPYLITSGLAVPLETTAAATSRQDHLPHLAELLAEMQEVARKDPEAQW